MARLQHIHVHARNASVALAALAAVIWLALAAAPATTEAVASQIAWSRPQAPLALDKLGPLVPPVFGPNVRANTDSTNYGQHEPGLAVSRTDNDVVFVAAKDYRVGNIKRVWIYGSTDGGVTWPVQQAMPALPPTVNESDPVVMARDDGRIYVSCLTTGNNGIFITWTDDNGKTWWPSVPIVQNQPGLQDKDWFAIDNNPASPYYHRMYMMYAPDAAFVVEHHSTDGGQTWSPRQQIGGSNTEYTYPVVASDGTVYNFMMLNWGGGQIGTVQMTKSTNGGVDWSTPSTVAMADQAGYNIRPGDEFRFFSIISAGVDPTSQGPNHTLYVSWTDDRSFNTTGTDVIYVKSTDGGANWSQPVNVAHAAGRNECPGCDNITPMITVGPDGKVHAFWLDRADRPPPTGDGWFDSWYSSSTDGGTTWDPAIKVSTEPQNLNVGFPPGSGNAAGDYWGLDVSGDSVYVAWNDTRLNGQQDILVSRGIMGGPSVTPTSPTAQPTNTSAPSATPTYSAPTSTATSQVTSTPTATPTTTTTPIAGCEPDWQNIQHPVGYGFADIAAVSSDAAWAVSSDTIQYWNGTEWEVKVHLTPVPMPTPPPSLEYYSLRALSVYSATDIWAAGMHGDFGGNTFGLVMHWDGAAWTIVSQWAAPHEAPQGGTLRYLYDIKALGPGEAITVGGSYFSGPPLILRCTTEDCTADTPPHNFGPYNSVSASSPNDIWAVGGSGVSLTAHFDGTSWQQVSTPSTGTLHAIVSVAPNDAWAGGDGGLMHWDGTAWSPYAGGPPQVHSLSGIAWNDLWAADSGSGVYHWDGAGWTLSLSYTNAYSAVSALAPDNVWASGTLTAHYTEPQQFEDVQPNNTFYSHIQTLSCYAIIQGYPCGGAGEPCVPPDERPYFRPNASITRGQLSKVVSLASEFTEPVPSSRQTFADVPYGATFWEYIERMASRGIVEGYPCGGDGEPCDPQSRPYFRPNTPTTRGQISKITAIAAGYIQTPTTQTFTDVPPGSTFYVWVENLAQRDIMQGYPCGGPGEPCDAEQRPYFRPNNPATRGQVSKIVSNTFYP